MPVFRTKAREREKILQKKNKQIAELLRARYRDFSIRKHGQTPEITHDSGSPDAFWNTSSGS